MAKAKYTRGKDGYFQTKVWDGTYTDLGKKNYVPLRTKKSSKVLENMVIEHNQSVKERKLVKRTEMTFYEYAKSWRTIYKATKSKNTQAMYDRIIKKFSALEGVRLQDVARLHYQILLNNADGHPRTQQQIQLTFKQVIKSAIADRYLPAGTLEQIFQNAASIRYAPGEKRPLTPYEKEAVFKADLSPEDQAFIYILYGCGLRRGEVLALTCFDVDIEDRTLSVQHSLAFDGNNPYIKEPKSSNGYRTVPIPAKVFPFIKSYVKGLRRERLFCSRGGGWVTKSCYRKKWARIISALQAESECPIVDLTAHVFRHNYCTNLCYQIPTISIKKIAELMGDTEKMVIEVYNHVLLEKEDAQKAVENALNF